MPTHAQSPFNSSADGFGHSLSTMIKRIIDALGDRQAARRSTNRGDSVRLRDIETPLSMEVMTFSLFSCRGDSGLQTGIVRRAGSMLHEFWPAAREGRGGRRESHARLFH